MKRGMDVNATARPTAKGSTITSTAAKVFGLPSVLTGRGSVNGSSPLMMSGSVSRIQL